MIGREQALIHPCKIYIWKLQALCGMDGHQYRMVAVPVKGIDVSDPAMLELDNVQFKTWE